MTIIIVPLRDNNWTNVIISDSRIDGDGKTNISVDTNKKGIILNDKEYLQ